MRWFVSPRISQRCWWWAGVLAVLAALVGAGIWWGNRPTDGEQYVFVIPKGAAQQRSAGQDTRLPGTIELTYGRNTALVIRNEDDFSAQVGPVRVGPGQTFTLPYRSRGTFDLVCSVHQSGQLRIIVR